MQPRVRDVVRERLAAYADLHAISNTLPTRSRLSLFEPLSLRLLQGGFAALLIAVSMGGVAYASNGALPGDKLYAVKTQVVEPLESALLYDAKARATWNAILAERRLTEAATLATTDRLDEVTRIDLEERFARHAERSSGAAGEVRAKGDVAVALAVHSDLEARLSAHVDLFSYIASDAERPEAAKLLARIAEKRDTVAAERQETETEVSRRALAYGDRQIEVAERVTEEVARTTKVEGAAGGSIDARINAARVALESARASSARGEGGIAYVATQAAARFTHEASILARNRGILALAPQPIPTRAIESSSASVPATEEASAAATGPADAAVMLLKIPESDDGDTATSTDAEDANDEESDRDKKNDKSSSDNSRGDDASQDSQDDEDSQNDSDSSSTSSSSGSDTIRNTVNTVRSVLGL